MQNPRYQSHRIGIYSVALIILLCGLSGCATDNDLNMPDTHYERTM